MSTWIDRGREHPVPKVAELLGMDVQPSGATDAFGPCPACGEERRSSSDYRPPCRVTPDQEGWLHESADCEVRGDAPDLVAWRICGAPIRDLDRRARRKVRKWFDELRLRGLRGVIRPSRSLPSSGGAGTRRGPGPPPVAEVAELWEEAVPVTGAPGVAAWLASRSLDAGLIAKLDLARATHDGAPSPAWARRGGESWHDGGFGLLVPFFDASGEMRSLRGRRHVPGMPKAASPYKHSSSGLVMANSRGRELLATGAPATSPPAGEQVQLLVCEGEVDYLTWAVATRDDDRVAVVGIIAGSWNEAIAERLPPSRVILRTHLDSKGDDYAQAIADSLGGDHTVLRRTAPPLKDENELLAAGDLPKDPEDGCVAMAGSARAATSATETAHGPRPFGAFVPDALGRYRARRDGREKPVPLPWRSVGEALNGGLWPGVYIVVGMPGSGKSQWVLQVAVEAAKRAAPVLYVALEMSELDLVARIASLRLGTRSWTEVWRGERRALGSLERRLSELDDLGSLHLECGRAFNWDAAKLVESANQVTDGAGGNTPLVVVDYLQLVRGERDGSADLREQIGRAAYAAERVAIDQKAAVLLVSSTSREHYSKLGGGGRVPPGEGNPGRWVGAGKESGELEYAADGVLVLVRDPDRSDRSGPWTTHLALAKVRAGVPQWCKLSFDGCRFEEPRPGLLASSMPAASSGEEDDDDFDDVV